MNSKLIVADPIKCTGCGECQTVCSLNQCGISNPALSRIRIFSRQHEGLYIPVSCQQCEDAPCMAVCPKEAIYRDQLFNRVMIDYGRCISCRMCISACPFGAMGFDSKAQKVFKCNLCDGNPQCVNFCYPKSLSYVEPERIPYSRLRHFASTYIGIRRSQNALFQGQ